MKDIVLDEVKNIYVKEEYYQNIKNNENKTNDFYNLEELLRLFKTNSK